MVGVEARADLSEQAAAYNAEFADRLTVVQRALHERDDEIVPFFVIDEKNEAVTGSSPSRCSDSGCCRSTSRSR